MQSRNITHLNKLGKGTETILSRIEIPLIILIIIGFILKSNDISQGMYILIISISILVILYYFLAFKHLGENNFAYDRFIWRILCWSWALAAMGTLFSLNRYPGYEQMLTVSIVSIIIAAAVIGISKLRFVIHKIYGIKEIIRTVIWLIIVMVFKYFPDISIIGQ